MRHSQFYLVIIPLVFLMSGCDTLPLSQAGKERERLKAVQFEEGFQAMEEVVGKYFTIISRDRIAGQVVAQTLPVSTSAEKTRQRIVAELVDHGEGFYEVEVRVLNQVDLSLEDPFAQVQSHYRWRTIDFDVVLETKLVQEIYRAINGEAAAGNVSSRSIGAAQRGLARSPTASSTARKRAQEPGTVNSRHGATSHMAFLARRATIRDPFVKAIILGDMHFKEGNYEGAEEQFLIAQRSQPDHPVTWLALGHTRFALGKYAEAERALRIGLGAYRNWSSLKMNRKDFYGKASEFFEQLSDLERAAQFHPEDAGLQFLLGYNYYFSGRRSLAAKAFQKASSMRRDPLAKKFLDLLGSDQVI